jgi:hypothetical protein
MPQMTDEAPWLRPAFDDLEQAESTSLTQLLREHTEHAAAPHPEHAVRSVVRTAGAFGLVLAASVWLGRPRP